MTSILTDLSAQSLAVANRANLYALFRYLEQSPTAEFTRRNGVERWHIPHPYFWLNSVLCSRDATPADTELVAENLAYFQSKKTTSIGWWLEDSVSQESWESLLVPHGFTRLEGPVGMGLDLSQLPKRVSVPAGLEIRVLTETESLRTYAQLLTTIFGFPAETESATYNWLLGLGLELPYASYMAYLDGKPVGTSAVFYGAGVAGIYSVGVLPEVRGQGIGAVLTLQPLLDARENGYQAATLQSSPMGLSVYSRLGFEQHCRLGCFQYKFTP